MTVTGSWPTADEVAVVADPVVDVDEPAEPHWPETRGSRP